MNVRWEAECSEDAEPDPKVPYQVGDEKEHLQLRSLVRHCCFGGFN